MPEYRIKLHPAAKRELTDLPDEDRENITDAIRTVSEQQEPSSHPATKHLDGHDGLFRIRSGQVRAICDLQKPSLYVLKIGDRNTVYRRIDDIDERLPA